MIDVDSARARILASLQPLPTVAVPILDALGLVCADEIAAPYPLPRFANSAMDGFAVRTTDTSGARPDQPVRLRIIGEVFAGSCSSATLEPGTAIRITTGAPIPPGADAVVRFEETGNVSPVEHGDSVDIFRAPVPGEHIRQPGEDVQEGSFVLRPGDHLDPPAVALLAALGHTKVRVHRRPRVAVVSTGDEVVPPGTPLRPGQIYDTNSFMLAAMVRWAGGEPISAGIAKDSQIDVHARLGSIGDADLILTSGGVSVGEYDLVKQVLSKHDTIAFWQVQIKPGKPLAFGHIGSVPLIGLPGNPVAAAVAFVQFARPAIRKMLGHRHLDLPVVQARIRDRVENRGGCRHFVRVWVEPDGEGRYCARVAGPQGSGVLTSLVRANGLLVIPEEMPVAEPGMVLPVQLFDWDIV
ncbi:MAG: molybdopterin molybdenumtransferase MoeA [Chloroflexota bacterium]